MTKTELINKKKKEKEESKEENEENTEEENEGTEELPERIYPKKFEKPKAKPMPEEEMETIKLNMSGKKEIWQGIIDKLIGLRNDVALKFTKNGIETRLTDEGSVALVEHTVKKNAFDDYSVSHEIEVGVDLTKLQKHIKAYTGDLTVTNDKSKLVFKGESGKTSRMGLLDNSLYNDVKIPTMPFEVQTKTPFAKISEMVKISSEKGFDVEALRFCIKDNKFSILMEGETDDVRFPICAINNLTGKKNFHTFYSRKYLEMFSFGNDDEIIVKFGKDIPLYLEHDDGKEHTTYLLAPRIETNDEKEDDDED